MGISPLGTRDAPNVCVADTNCIAAPELSDDVGHVGHRGKRSVITHQ